MIEINPEHPQMFALPILIIAAMLAVLLPFLFAEVMFTGLTKLHLTSSTALACMIAIFLGGFFNIPIKSVVRDWDVIEDPLAVYGLSDFWPQLRRLRRTTIIAINVGGCLIPAGLVLYEIAYLAATNRSGVATAVVGCIVNVIVCYLIARPVAGVGIVMPGIVSPFVAAVLALSLASDIAPPVAFIIGVVGPLVGADLLHLRDLKVNAIGIVSVGGAGTFDGIVLSGIVAAYLA